MHDCRTILLLGVLLAAHGQARSACEAPLLEVAAGGQIVAGSKAALIEYLNAGGEVRVGWQLDWNVDGHIDISHWANTAFVSVFEDEVFVQFPQIQRQVPRPGESRVDLAGAGESTRWSGVLGSDGVLQGLFEGGEVRRFSVASQWCRAATDGRADAAPAPAPCVRRWTEQFRNTADGATAQGSRADLLAALRRGDTLRVAWGGTYADGSYSVEHVADPVFISIVGGEQVVVQLPEHIGQTAYARLDGAQFSDQAQVMWRGLLRTDGLFDAVWVDRATGGVVRKLPQRAAVSWLTLSLPAACELAEPLQLAVPGGVMPDMERAAERIPR